jgi:hypothetical protein
MRYCELVELFTPYHPAGHLGRRPLAFGSKLCIHLMQQGLTLRIRIRFEQ